MKHIDFNTLDKKSFNVTKREHPHLGDVVLIGPKKSKHSWSADELHLRSLLCNSSGEIICSGFHKFKNYGEDAALDVLTREGILSGKAHFVEKMDGSLIIRSVHNGHVFFRTRGSHYLGDFEDPVMSLVRDNHPRLLDANYLEDQSTLFEYISPDNQIVVDYLQAELVALGRMFLSDKKLPSFQSDPEFLEKIASETGVRIPKFFNGIGNTPEELTKHVSTWRNAEGLVIWIPQEDGSMHLSKIKAKEYVRIHSLRYHLSGEKTRKIFHATGIDNEEQLKTSLHSWGIDWETATFILPTFKEYLEQRDRVRGQVSAFIATLNVDKVAELPTRKKIALAIKNLADGNKRLFSIGMCHVLGEQDKVEKRIKAWELGISVGAVANWEADAKLLVEGLTERFYDVPDND